MIKNNSMIWMLHVLTFMILQPFCERNNTTYNNAIICSVVFIFTGIIALDAKYEVHWTDSKYPEKGSGAKNIHCVI